MVRNWMQQTYDQFTQRVMTTRSAKIADIDKVARGRIFLAKQAKELGMVDELGGTTAAIAYAAKRAGFDSADDYEIRTLPARRTLADLFGGGDSSGAGASTEDGETHLPFGRPLINVTVAPDSILHLLGPGTRQQIGQQIRFMQLLQQRPVVLMSPYVVTFK
jgi:ClpP class serine protease